MLVCVIGGYVLYELLKIKYCVLIILFVGRPIKTLNILVAFYVPIARFLLQFICPHFDIVLGRVT